MSLNGSIQLLIIPKQMSSRAATEDARGTSRSSSFPAPFVEPVAGNCVANFWRSPTASKLHADVRSLAHLRGALGMTESKFSLGDRRLTSCAGLERAGTR